VTAYFSKVSNPYEFGDGPLPWLIACEESGTVRDAFLDAGIFAVSCDLKPTRSTRAGLHVQGDVRLLLAYPWAGIIAHPTCTYLTNAGVRWLYTPSKTPAILTGEARWAAMREAADFFNLFLDYSHANLDVPVIVENPVMHKHALALVRRKHSQTIQPYQFGHLETKRTALWLSPYLPLLQATNDVEREMRKLPKKETHKVHYASSTLADRAEVRSVFFRGVAEAMADQWGPFGRYE
jgi:hypothetical protein